MEPWSLNTLALCFGGGIVGAAMGGLWAFELCALLIFAGCLVVAAGGSDFLLLQVGLGPLFGPHVGGFCAGIAASNYAVGVRKNHPSGAAKDILSPLIGTSWDVLVVGGLFSVGAHVLLQVLGKIPIINQFDTIALDVVISNLLARLLFLKEMPWGASASIQQHGYFGTNDTAISWVPWQARAGRYLALGLGVGLLSGGLAMGLKQQLDPMAAKNLISPAGAFVVPLIMGWCIASLNLICLQCGTGSIQKVPVYHAMAILSALAFLYSGSIVVAGVVGLLAALLQEFCARMVYNHGSSHIDPPATAIATGTLILNLVFKPEFLSLGKFFK
ncbi:hypothetical protein HZB60_04005 [candidate division KSB1 bacterium]|nr:hypothetical protein [candidate division KSB1 bacterium]